MGEQIRLGVVEPGQARAVAVGDAPPLLAGARRVGLSEAVPMVAATVAAALLGTRARVLRAKCTRRRCQLAPLRTAVIASYSPSWASLITNCTLPTEASTTIHDLAEGERREPYSLPLLQLEEAYAG